MNETCRICLSTENLNSSIFSCSPVYNVTFAYTFTACTSVQILIDDGLPSLICDNCLESLESFLGLCQRCIKSDMILRNNQNCITSSYRELRNDDIEIKTEDKISKDWQGYDSQTGSIIKNSYSPFVFVTTEDRTKEKFEKWYSRQDAYIKEESELLEQKPENNMCAMNKRVNGSKNKNLREKIDTFNDNQPSEIFLKNKNLNTKGGSKIRQFQCEICGMRYSRKCTLTLHVRTHTGERPYKCPLCPKSFAQKITLNKHSLIHSGERPFSCDKCGKSFTQKCNLLIHMTIHTGEQRFHCDICSKKFSQKNHLTSHSLTHSGEQRYVCKFCGKKFSLKCGLRAHETTHSNLKPFKCQTCSKSFTRRERCKTHEQIHTGVKPYECQICRRAFGRKDKLTSHLKTHSNENSKVLVKKKL